MGQMEGMESAMKKHIKHPYMRVEVVLYLQDLADREKQLKDWTSQKAAHRFWDTLGFAISMLFDTLDLEEDAEGQIGYSLYNEEEVQAIKPVMRILRRVLDEIGRQQPDDAYITSPLWDEVVRTAGEAYEVFKKHDELYDFQAD